MYCSLANTVDDDARGGHSTPAGALVLPLLWLVHGKWQK
jgi:hypothetical protein